LRYLALVLVGCAGVAVLGARRPGVAAWDFVVGGLLVVLASWLVEGVLTGGGIQLGGVRSTFLAGLLAFASVNYLFTRMGLAALVLGVACALEMSGLVGGPIDGRAVDWMMAVVPWVAWVLARKRSRAAEADRVWLDFRDRYGLAWGQHVRGQFNRSAANAGSPAVLEWGGLRGIVPAAQPDCAARLRALTKRFGSETGMVEG